MSALSLQALNALDQAGFTQALGDIFEETPLIAARTWPRRPFNSLDALHQAMVQVVNELEPAEQLALICAHPELGSRLAMAPSSVAEQTGAGLDRLTAAEYEQLQRLNAAYRERFGFPFVMAVKGQPKDSIISALEHRLQQAPTAEITTALEQIAQIAWLRLQDRVSEP
jgi:2-oxo-4-hydroxy-4-carboxy-5-ureidoimidazoline decarboxylase